MAFLQGILGLEDEFLCWMPVEENKTKLKLEFQQ
jgi:hypothetical protein